MGNYRSYLKVVSCFVAGIFFSTLIVFIPVLLLSDGGRDTWLRWFFEADFLPPFVGLSIFFSAGILVFVRIMRSKVTRA